MRILIVTHSFFPELTPRAFRWEAVARRFVELGHEVDVVSARPPGTSAQETIDGITVYRVRDRLSRSQLSSTGGQNSNRVFARELVRWIYKNTWRRLYWPDYACAWHFPAVDQASKLLAEKNYEQLISVSHPFTGHLVGLNLKRRHPSLPWLVDIGDPFCLMDDPSPNNAMLYGFLNRRVDRSVLREADVISVTTSGTRNAYARIFPEVECKMRVIPPLLSMPASRETTGSQTEDGRLRLVFVGTLYRKLRSPEPLLNLFDRLITMYPELPIDLHFLGNLNDTAELIQPYELLIGRRVFLHGMVSREHAREAMQSASMLINIGNKSKTQLPSKLIEYIATGKPILNLISIRDDSSSDMLNSYPGALTLDLSKQRAQEADLRKIANYLRNPPIVNLVRLEVQIAQYRIENVTRAYLAAFSGS